LGGPETIPWVLIITSGGRGFKKNQLRPEGAVESKKNNKQQAGEGGSKKNPKEEARGGVKKREEGRQRSRTIGKNSREKGGTKSTRGSGVGTSR